MAEIKEKGRYLFIKEKALALKKKRAHSHQPEAARLYAMQKAEERAKEKSNEESSVEQLESAAYELTDLSYSRLGNARKENGKSASHGETRNSQFVHKCHENKEQKTIDRPIKEKTRMPSADIKTRGFVETRSTAAQKMEQAREAVKKQYVSKNVRKQTARLVVQDKIKAALTRSAKRAGESLFLIGGGVLAAILPLLIIISFVALMFDSGEQPTGTEPLSEEVQALSPYIFAYAYEHGVEDYIGLIKAVMMQESAGRGTDPMQASECIYNTKYPNTPGGITDPEYSIDVGIQYFRECLELAAVQGPEDIDGISLAIQGYNFGSGYISWAIRNYGGHSQLSALEFSEMMANRYGWTSYGDINYVNHVLRYYIPLESGETTSRAE